MRHATCDRHYATGNRQCAACSMQHARCNARHAICKAQQAKGDMRLCTRRWITALGKRIRCAITPRASHTTTSHAARAVRDDEPHARHGALHGVPRLDDRHEAAVPARGVAAQSAASGPLRGAGGRSATEGTGQAAGKSDKHDGHTHTHNTHTHTRTCTHKLTHSDTRTRTHTRTHARTNARTRTHARTHARKSVSGEGGARAAKCSRGGSGGLGHHRPDMRAGLDSAGAGLGRGLVGIGLTVGHGRPHAARNGRGWMASEGRGGAHTHSSGTLGTTGRTGGASVR
jgi:hypothetical protein